MRTHSNIPHSTSTQRHSPLLVRLGCTAGALLLAGVFILHFRGIPRISSSVPLADRETLAQSIQLWYLLSIVPAIILAVYTLSTVQYLREWSRAISSLFFNSSLKLFLSVLFCLALLLSLLCNQLLLHQGPHIVDSHNYYYQAKLFSNGYWWVPSNPQLKTFFTFIGIMDYQGKRYASSFPGHPFMLMLGELLDVPWAVNPLQGALLIIVLYFLGARIFSDSIGRLAAFLLAISPFRVFQCSLFMAHPTAAMGSILTILLFFRGVKHQRVGNSLLIGTLSGFLYLTRPQSGLPLLLPWALWWCYTSLRKRQFVHILLAILPLAVAILFGFYYNNTLTGSPFVSPRDIVAPSLTLGFGGNVGKPLPSGGFSGHTVSQGFSHTFTNLKLMIRESLLWGGWTCIAFILGILAMKAHRLPIVCMLAGMALLMAIYFAYPINSPLFGARYYFEALPLYILLISYGLSRLAHLLTTMKLPFLGRGMVFEPAMFIILMIMSATTLILPSQIDRYFSDIHPNTLKKVTKDLENQRCIVFVRGDYYTLSYAFAANDPLFSGPLLFATDKGYVQNRELMKHYPDRSYYLYRETIPWKGDGSLMRLTLSGEPP